ncbi:MAG: hemolysin family protein [bacterium]
MNFTPVYVALGFLVFTAFIAAAEVAVFSIDEVMRSQLREKGGLWIRLLLKLLEKPENLAMALLLYLDVAITLFAYSLTLFFLGLSRDYPHYERYFEVGGGAVTLFLAVVFGEIVPKSWALVRTPALAVKVAPAIYVLYHIAAWPAAGIVRLFHGITHQLKGDEVAFYESRVLALVLLGHRSGAIHEEERKMIENVFEFRDLRVNDVMIHRVDTVALPTDATLKRASELVIEFGHSRIPVFDGSIDNVVGILYAKDVLDKLFGGAKPVTMAVSSCMKPALLVPETKKVSELFDELRKKKVHLAVVVDEHGGTAGIVTLEDLLEEIVGDIHDEYDVSEFQIEFLNPDKSSAIVSGRVKIEDLNDQMGLGIAPAEDYDTIAGLIYHGLGRMPKRGDHMALDGIALTVLDVKGTRIRRVKVARDWSARMER